MNAAQIVNRVTARAVTMMRANATYGIAVLQGRQNWSGSDLEGKAARYSSKYARTRATAARCLRRAGGSVLAVDHGKQLSAVRVCTDDFGNEVYATRRGYAWPNSRAQYKVSV